MLGGTKISKKITYQDQSKLQKSSWNIHLILNGDLLEDINLVGKLFLDLTVNLEIHMNSISHIQKQSYERKEQKPIYFKILGQE